MVAVEYCTGLKKYQAGYRGWGWSARAHLADVPSVHYNARFCPEPSWAAPCECECVKMLCVCVCWCVCTFSRAGVCVIFVSTAPTTNQKQNSKVAKSVNRAAIFCDTWIVVQHLFGDALDVENEWRRTKRQNLTSLVIYYCIDVISIAIISFFIILLLFPGVWGRFLCLVHNSSINFRSTIWQQLSLKPRAVLPIRSTCQSKLKQYWYIYNTAVPIIPNAEICPLWFPFLCSPMADGFMLFFHFVRDTLFYSFLSIVTRHFPL